MKKKLPIGYYLYLIVSLLLFWIFWQHYNNEWYLSLLFGFILGIPATYIIVVIHALIERMK